MKDELLNMLESLLSITEPLREQLDGSAHQEWGRISARCADIREGRGSPDEPKLSRLIEALDIFLKYGDIDYPTCCEHDVLHVNVEGEKVSQEDTKKLEELGFFVGDEWPDHFISFRYGSA